MMQYYDFPFWYQPESLETIIAREIPKKTLSHLDKKSKRKLYVDSLSIGSEIVNTYIHKSSEMNIGEIKDISIKLKRKVIKISFKK